MKTRYSKNFCKIIIVLLAALFYQRAIAATKTVGLLKTSAGPGDTSQVQKPGKFKRHRKIKKDDDDNKPEDGVSDDIRARGHQEFLQQRDPHLNRVPLERLLIARNKRDQFLNNVKIRVKNTTPRGNLVKPGSNSIAPANAPPTISNLQWQERGPNNVGGRTRALIFDMGDAANGYKKVFAGGVGGGLWVTSDITATTVQWTKINDFFDNIAISCIAQNPVNPKEIYAGTGEGFLNGDAIQGLGVWKTSDGGATWAQLPSTTGFKYINAILVDRNGSVYVAGETDIFVGFGVDQSTDGGNTWTNVITSAEAGADLQMAANGDVYASTGVIYLTGHIYISDFAVNGVHTGNSGTWVNITPENTGVITPATTSWNRIKLAMAPGDANIVYAFFEPDYNTTGSLVLSSVQQYNRSANTWTVETVPTEAFGNGQSWYSIAAAVDPNNSSVLYAGSLDAEKSTDGGSTWTQVTQWDANTTASNYVHADHHAYVYPPGSSTRLLMGTDGGIFYTVNANATPSFVNKNNGYDVTQFYSVALHPTNFNYALAGAQDNGSEKLQGAGIGSSTTATGGDGADVFIDQTNGNIQVTSYVYDQYYVSTNNGASFNQLGSYGNGQFINPTDYDPSTKSLYAGSASGRYFRAENILSPTYNEVAVSGFNSANVTAVTVAPLTANRVYFGLDNGTVVRVDNAQTGSSLTGVVLKPIATLAANKSVTLSCINVDPTTEDHILVTYSNYGVIHILETKNASAATPTWTDISGNLPDMPVRWSLFYPGDPTKAIIATELGVWTTDLINGSSTVWDPTNTGLANVEVDMLKYRAADRTLAAATHGRGVFTTILPSTADATLSNLTISNGTLNPAFASGTTSYTDAIANLTTSITVVPTSNISGATLTVNGVALASGVRSASIPMNEGNNTVTIVVTALDGVTTKTYTVAVNRLPSSNALLASISLSPVSTLVSTSGPGYLNFTSAVPYSTSSVQEIATAKDATATITVNGVAVTSGSPSQNIPVSVGANTITTVLTAQDGVTTKTVIVTVNRALSPDANLSALKISTGTLSPVFSAATTGYTANVANAVTSITVTPTTDDAAGTVKVNGTAVTSGTASAAVPLVVGANAIKVVVTAPNGTTTQTYTVTVTRAPSTDALLTSVKLTPVSGLTVVTGPSYVNYTTSVPNTTGSVTVTATEQDATATIKVNGVKTASGVASAAIPLAVGSNTINIVSTAQDGVTTKTYTITATRAGSSDALLTAIKLTPASTLTVVSGSGYVNYTTSVPYTSSSVTVTATTQDATATITVNGVSVKSGAASSAVPLVVGSNTITTVVTAQDGKTTKSYIITATRAPSNDALLTSIKLIPASTLTIVSGPGYVNYTTSVPNKTSSVTVTATKQDAGATITVNGITTASGAASAAIPLAVGSNTITTVVTAADGTTTKSYIITATRAATGLNNPDETLSVTKPANNITIANDGITVHQGISPNGDGINDILKIDGITNYPDNNLTIVDRNGLLVYEAKGYGDNSKLFDGHSSVNGKMQLPGTYFYSLDYTVNGQVKHQTGYIILKY